MRLLSPEWLWLGALALPVFLLHLHFRRRRPQRVTSLIVWRELVGEGTAGIGVRWLRDALALLFLVLALGAFAVSAAEPVTGRPKGEPQHYVIVIDGSAATLVRPGSALRERDADAVDPLRHTTLLETAADAVRRLPVGATVTVWTALDRPSVLVGPTGDLGAAGEAVLHAPLELHAPTVSETLELARRAERLARRDAVFLVLTGSADVPDTEADVHVGAVRDRGPVENGAILAVEQLGDRLRVEVAPHPRFERLVELHWLTDQPNVTPLFPVAPGSGGTQTFEAALPADADGGVNVLFARSDEFEMDDVLSLQLRRDRPLRVGVATSGDSAAASLLRAAVSAATETVDIANSFAVPRLDAGQPAQFDVLVSETEDLPEHLPSVRFQAAGRSVEGPSLFLPTAHPILEGVDLAGVRVARARVLDVRPTDTVLIESAAGPLAVLRTTNGVPSVRFGFGTVDSTLGIEAAFPVLVRNALRYAARPALVPTHVRSGEPMDFSALLEREERVVISGVRAGFRRELRRGDPLLLAPYVDGRVDKALVVSDPDGQEIARVAVHWSLPPDIELAVPTGAPDLASAVSAALAREPAAPPERHWSSDLAILGALFLGLGAVLLR